MSILIPSVVIGAISSLLTEIFKFLPVLAKTDLRKQITAFLVTLIIVLGYITTNPEVDKSDFIGFILLSLAVAYGTFKTVIKPIFSVVSKLEKE